MVNLLNYWKHSVLWQEKEYTLPLRLSGHARARLAYSYLSVVPGRRKVCNLSGKNVCWVLNSTAPALQASPTQVTDCCLAHTHLGKAESTSRLPRFSSLRMSLMRPSVMSFRAISTTTIREVSWLAISHNAFDHCFLC